MDQVVVQDPLVLVLAEGDNPGTVSHAKGHLFEEFTANLLHVLGYEKPTRLHLGVTSDGVELDVSVEHDLDGTRALVECKAYSSPVKSEQLSTFYGKLSAARLDHQSLRGVFVAIPKLTSEGHELAAKISSGDKAFRLFTAKDIWDVLSNRGMIIAPEAPGSAVSDFALVVHASGIYVAGLEIDPGTKTAARVLIRAKEGGVNPDVVRLLADNPYAQGLKVTDTAIPLVRESAASGLEPTIVEVTGSQSDFEYQLPASPRFFVGRRRPLKEVKTRLGDQTGLIVLNAQSGWGKSSLALKIAAQVKSSGGYAVVIDARTATAGAYVPSVLRRAAESAQAAGLLTLDPSATWATLAGAIKSIEGASWKSTSGRLVIFFDQFENVFKDEELTRQFRDLALWALDSKSPLLIGFAWKTDFVGWTENHPYQLRDEIRNSASLVSLEPFGASDVDTLLRRLQNEVGRKLSPEIRQRLREYSQGLPWLLKKLSGHVIQEFKAGKSQEQLVAEALNVANLFESDLANLSPSERETLKFVARYAPVQAGEVVERYNAGVVQSLLDQRLVVQVGEKLDTYWDTFRDYLNTGRAPIEDSYILRQMPRSVARLLADVIANEGAISIADVATKWQTSENVVWNVARELRQLGLALYKPNQVQILPEIIQAEDIEADVRKRVVFALRRHRAFSAFNELSERGQGSVAIPQFAKQLELVFPAVEVAASTWQTYARIFVAWFEYGGLVTFDDAGAARIAPDGSAGKGALTSTTTSPRVAHVFPTFTPRPCISILEQLATGPKPVASFHTQSQQRAIQQLSVLKAVEFDGASLRAVPGLVNSGAVVQTELVQLLREAVGGSAALDLLAADPSASRSQVGMVIRDAFAAAWADSTVEHVGKCFRAWAKHAGVEIGRAQPKS